MKHFLSFLAEELAALERANLRRRPPAAAPVDPRSFCSNDYLGFASRPSPPAPSGASASRLIAGERVEHAELEGALSRWLEAEAALLFSSGYAANVGTLSALVRPGDLVVSDALNHASLIDGARLSRGEVVVVPHNDVPAVEEALAAPRAGRAWVVVESYYSMDADSPDLAALRRLCDEHAAGLFVDEAHAIGVLGPRGRGLCAAAGVKPDVLVGTLGKALGSQGAFVAGAEVLRDWLWNRARSFVFSTGLSPAAAAAARRSLDDILADPGRARDVLEKATRLRATLARTLDEAQRDGHPHGVRLMGGGHVIPLLVGDAGRALTLAAALRDLGIGVQAVRPPTVPAGTARLRLTVTANHDDHDLARVAAALGEALRSAGP